MTIGVPVRPMLANPIKDLSEAFTRFGKENTEENTRFVAEYKYDGERVQVHMSENGKVHLFSRR